MLELFLPHLYYICRIDSLINYNLETFTTYTWQRDDGPNIQTITESDAEKHSFLLFCRINVICYHGYMSCHVHNSLSYHSTGLSSPCHVLCVELPCTFVLDIWIVQRAWLHSVLRII